MAKNRKSRKKNLRGQILEAAYTVCDRTQSFDITFKDIARELGVPKAEVKAEFESVEEIIRTLLDAAAENFRARIDKVRGSDHEDTIRKLAFVYVSHIARHADSLNVLPAYPREFEILAPRFRNTQEFVAQRVAEELGVPWTEDVRRALVATASFVMLYAASQGSRVIFQNDRTVEVAVGAFRRAAGIAVNDESVPGVKTAAEAQQPEKKKPAKAKKARKEKVDQRPVDLPPRTEPKAAPKAEVKAATPKAAPRPARKPASAAKPAPAAKAEAKPAQKPAAAPAQPAKAPTV
ncbi:TetR/AcrR family transcriptional regulator [Sutterella sp.]|uniref:TetR/AcrR family transcriptional regulator n=1 Tax=Sutterella sp. TaxID=1981025 RepID=UPI0026DED001|nr:hypothetical protein [Sutterella sp.]MDO5531799.1 hypothetical protein [Sutterella sp.]